MTSWLDDRDRRARRAQLGSGKVSGTSGFQRYASAMTGASWPNYCDWWACWAKLGSGEFMCLWLARSCVVFEGGLR